MTPSHSFNLVLLYVLEIYYGWLAETKKCTPCKGWRCSGETKMHLSVQFQVEDNVFHLSF